MSFENIDFSNWVPPGTLETLRVYDLPLKYGFLGILKLVGQDLHLTVTLEFFPWWKSLY